MGLKLDRRRKKVCVCILFLYYCILWSKNIIWLYFLSERRHYNFFHPLRDFQMSWTGLFKNIEIHIYVNLNAQWRRHKFVKKTPNFIWHYLVRSKIGKLVQVFVAFFEYLYLWASPKRRYRLWMSDWKWTEWDRRLYVHILNCQFKKSMV